MILNLPFYFKRFLLFLKTVYLFNAITFVDRILPTQSSVIILESIVYKESSYDGAKNFKALTSIHKKLRMVIFITICCMDEFLSMDVLSLI